MKNKISDKINNTMAILTPLTTIFWCVPSFLASLMVSFHQTIVGNANDNRADSLIVLDLIIFRFRVI